MAENDRQELTYKQRKALSALLACQTIGEAAELAGVADKTLRRWLDLPYFSQALTAAIGETTGEVVRRLSAGRGAMLDVLFDLATDDQAKDSDRRLAAQSWLSLSHKYHEIDYLEKRVAELEESFNGYIGK